MWGNRVKKNRMCLNLNDCQFKTGTSNYQSTDQKLTIDTEKPKRKEKIILKKN